MITPTRTSPESPSPSRKQEHLERKIGLSKTTRLISLTFSEQETTLPGESKKRASAAGRKH
jgi:hypothetical protein